MGLHLPGVIDVKVPGLKSWRPIRAGTPGAYLTGLPFPLVILPCATPVPAAILSYASGRRGALPGSGLLFTCGAGIRVRIVHFGTSIGLTARPHGQALAGRGSTGDPHRDRLYLLWKA